jgi:hypothetical protein
MLWKMSARGWNAGRFSSSRTGQAWRAVPQRTISHVSQKWRDMGILTVKSNPAAKAHRQGRATVVLFFEKITPEVIAVGTKIGQLPGAGFGDDERVCSGWSKTLRGRELGLRACRVFERNPKLVFHQPMCGRSARKLVLRMAYGMHPLKMNSPEMREAKPRL